jgi:hypothetical protein
VKNLRGLCDVSVLRDHFFALLIRPINLRTYIVYTTDWIVSKRILFGPVLRRITSPGLVPLGYKFEYVPFQIVLSNISDQV